MHSDAARTGQALSDILRELRAIQAAGDPASAQAAMRALGLAFGSEGLRDLLTAAVEAREEQLPLRLAVPKRLALKGR